MILAAAAAAEPQEQLVKVNKKMNTGAINWWV